MNSTSNGSFIPKRSTGKVAVRRAGKRIYIFSYIAYAFFFGTILSVLGIFLLNQQAVARLESYAEQLTTARDTFNRSDMNYVIALNEQLTTAKNLLDQHLAPSRLFDELEDFILKTVKLSGLDYVNTNESVKVTFKGSAETFDALLFQREVMEDSSIFNSAKVSGVTYGNESIEAVGASERSALDPVVTSAKISFTFVDSTITEKIGYQDRDAFVTVATTTTEILTSTTTQ